ncbi:uncharacterized protein LOC117643727 [Thrips palmi]|uniref:Uncharacterized protein LOC117643727 n=1 Tax=Thrips palmi TaxID=161013 RepID=A0A6P8YWW3_THRPL|nr:uncharacterized protein LOC117643727 [Thrips palmi]
MAILQRLLKSALCCEKTLLVPTSRCMSGLQSRLSLSTNSNSIQSNGEWNGNASTNIIMNLSSSSSDPKKLSFNSLLQRIDVAILPMSPVERLIKLQLPTISKHVSLEMPTTKASLTNVHINQKVIEYQAPQRGKVIKQLAVHMLNVRRRKMKKHQRKKWLKKFRILRMTVSKKRRMARETIFLSGLEEEMKLAESFNAEQYAAEKIKLAYRPLPQKEEWVRPLPWEFQPLYFNSDAYKKSKK